MALVMQMIDNIILSDFRELRFIFFQENGFYVEERGTHWRENAGDTNMF